MHNPTHYLQSQKELKEFIDNKLSSYSQLRNFDFGKKEKNSVSHLSKYISHGIISEYYILKEVLKEFKYEKVEKFIHEVFWRIYWKGWLELRPRVWKDYVSATNEIIEPRGFSYAYNGKTNVDCFNKWMEELKNKNYLHNHTRMWFASIWIFTLKLPWELGAKLFLKYLNDGDTASNTLSWRWVAGLQTVGKHYVAKSWNIEKFTGGRFSNILLKEQAKALISKVSYEIEEELPKYNQKKNDNLILFENDLNILDRKDFFEEYQKIFILLLDNESRNLELSENVLNFKSKLIDDFCSEFKSKKVIKLKKFDSSIINENNLDVIYPYVGENYDYLKNCEEKYKINLHYIYKKEDIYCWGFSRKGFFNFKKNIPQIIEKLDLR